MTIRSVTSSQFEKLSQVAHRRARVALMGEFSSGKSTLLNLIMAREVAQTQVTATHVPAVWLRRGTSAERVLFSYDGEITRDNNERTLLELGVDTCAMVQVETDDTMLEKFDIIDTPGISDPLMEHTPLPLVAGFSDLVVWCSTAVQAWRQSEVATWTNLPPRLRERSILVLTGIDRLSQKDRSRVLHRVEQEAGDLFRAIVPLASLDAAKAVEMDDRDAADLLWRESGGDALLSEITRSVTDANEARIALLERYEVRPDPEPSASLASGTSAVSPPPEFPDEPGLGSTGSKIDGRQTTMEKKDYNMSTDISALKDINAFIGACLVDSDTGLMLASEGGNAELDLDVAAAGNTEVVKAKLAAMRSLELDDAIEDILITLGKQYHLIRPLANAPTVFLYVALDKKTANLGMARLQVKKVEAGLSI